MENNQYNDENNFSLQKELYKYLVHWKWFLVTVFLCLIMAVFYLKKTVSVYNTTATILIKDSDEGRGLSELAAFEDLSSLSGGNNDIDDEVDIIKSKTLISKVIQKLSLNITQTTQKGLKVVDIYGKSPIKIKFEEKKIGPLEEEERIDDLRVLLDVNYSNKYVIINEETEDQIEHEFGKPLVLSQGIITITKSALFGLNFEQEDPIVDINVLISTVEDSALYFRKSISAIAKSKRSSLLDVSLKSSNKKKAIDVLNHLIEQYNKEAIEDKNLVSINTAKFIEERIILISKELDIVEDQKSAFKKGNKISNIQAESELFIEQVGDSQKRILGIETQLDLTNSMIDYLSKNKNDLSALLPSNIGIQNSSVNSSIVEFNRMVLDRNRLLESSTELNPLAVDLTANIISQRANLFEALENQKRNFLITKKDYDKEQRKINSKIIGIPKLEKDFRAIERQQGIKENLYLFLLKKREETSISMAVTAPVAKIIDRAYTFKEPVAPKGKIILLASLILGFLIPFGAIYVNDLFDTKINEKSDINNLIKDVPILAEVARVKRGSSDLLALNDRSVLGESFRILRTNLNYLVKSKKEKNKAVRVFVTSTIKGEGKTFVSFNTVLALADSDKRILVVGADVRNPQLHRYLIDTKNNVGLSEYLFDKDLRFEDVVNTKSINGHDIDYVTSGRIPPNPSELLMNGRLEELLSGAEDDYDYIIVDTAPTMLVTDTLTICQTADITMFVVRAGYTDKSLLDYSRSLREEGKIKNMAIVLNDVKEDKIGYGYGYGYGFDNKRSFWNRILKR